LGVVNMPASEAKYGRKKEDQSNGRQRNYRGIAVPVVLSV
jgi:hypothetical protein